MAVSYTHLVVYKRQVYGELNEPDKPENPDAVTGNIAKGKRATASGVESGVESCTADLAVDGDKKTDTSRWSAPQMKRGNDENQKQTMQWLELDLGNEVTEITSIDISFYLKVFSIDYVIKTRADKNAEGKTVKTMTTQSSSTVTNPVDSIKDVKALDRYVRFEFNLSLIHILLGKRVWRLRQTWRGLSD